MKSSLCVLMTLSLIWGTAGCSDDSNGKQDSGPLVDMKVLDATQPDGEAVDSALADAASSDADASGDSAASDGGKKKDGVANDKGTLDAAAKDKGAADKAKPDTMAADIPGPSEAGVPYGCTASCTSGAPYLCTKNKAGACVECEKDSHCAYNSGGLGNKCDPGYSICTCAKDTDCAGKIHGQKCDTTNKLCGCAKDSDCPTGRVCTGSLFGAKVCAPKCTSSAECNNSALPKCDVKLGRCVACFTDAECTTASIPYCSALGVCVACKAHGQCAGSRDGPRCDLAQGMCSCSASTDCGASVWGAKCKTYSVTTGGTIKLCRCDGDTDCAKSNSGPTCHKTYKRCSCAKDSECKLGGATVCNLSVAGSTYRICQKPCTKDTECSDETLPRCASSQCVQCTADADCTSSTTPFCQANVCVSCKANSDCSGTTPVCNQTSGKCVECAANTDCATHLNGGLCDTAKGTCTCKADIDCHKYAWGDKCDTQSYGRCTCADSTGCAKNVNGPACNTGYKKCTCADAKGCTVATTHTKCLPPYSGASYNHCQPGCKVDKDCAANSGAKVCLTTTGACVACKTVTQCQSNYSYPWYNVCTAKNLCLECEKDADCTSAGSLGDKCDAATNYCHCASDKACTSNSSGKRCDSTYKVCSCLLDLDCPTGKKCTGTSAFGTRYCK